MLRASIFVAIGALIILLTFGCTGTGQASGQGVTHQWNVVGTVIFESDSGETALSASPGEFPSLTTVTQENTMQGSSDGTMDANTEGGDADLELPLIP